MGMTCSMHRLTSAEIEQLIEHPDRLDSMLGFDKGPPMREVRPKGILGFLLRLTPVSIHEVDPDAPESAFDIDPEKTIDIEKGWHGLHFLLTGTSDDAEKPAGYMLSGGEEIDDEGLARALRPRDVKRFAAFLGSLTPEKLAQRYDPQRMRELDIYPGVWDRKPGNEHDSQKWLLDCFAEVQSFMTRAADAGDGVVIVTS